jgi:hypothetical protein
MKLAGGFFGLARTPVADRRPPAGTVEAPIDVAALVGNTMERYPQTMARLAE